MIMLRTSECCCIVCNIGAGEIIGRKPLRYLLPSTETLARI